MLHGHHIAHVILSVIIAVLGAWTALDLNGRALARTGRSSHAWLAATASVMGLSIWSMHFVAMLGFNAGVPITYDLALTLLSLLLAVLPTAGAFAALRRSAGSPPKLMLAGLAMGSGICLMHYVGMAAVRAPATLDYRLPLVALSFVIAVGASWAALWAVLEDRSPLFRVVGAVGLGLAICAMHYTAMAGATFTPTAAARMGMGDLGNGALTFSVAAATLLLLTTALIAALFDRRFEAIAVREAEAQARRQGDERLRDSETRLRLALDAARMATWEADLDTGTLRGSPQLHRLLGFPEDEPLDVEKIRQRYFPGERERLTAAGEQAFADAERFAEVEFRYLVPGRAVRWLLLRAQARLDEAGKPLGYIGVMMDISERKRAEAHQALLINELNHRVKNTLAIVQGLAQQTFRPTVEPSTARAAFEGRLAALSAAHDVLTRQNWSHASLRDIAACAVEPFRPADLHQITFEGPELWLPPKTSVSLAMALHELATNAVKYGALSTDSGSVALSWSVEPRGEDRHLHMVWAESGGPPVVTPSRRGFGTRMIERGLAAELGGTVTLDFAQEGLRCEIDSPLNLAP